MFGTHRLVTSGPVGAGLVIAVLGLVASCGQGFDRVAAVDSVQQAHPELTEEQAGCVADRLIDRYGLDDLGDEVAAGADPDGEPSPELTDAQYSAMFACGAEGDVATLLAEQLQASGVSADDAPCVADRLTADLDEADIGVLLSGEITEEFLAEFAAAMEACGVVTGE